MKINLSSASHTKSTSVINKEKKYKEDENINESDQALNQQYKKIGVKAIRKILRTLSTDSYPKEEMDLMIWVSSFITILKLHLLFYLFFYKPLILLAII